MEYYHDKRLNVLVYQAQNPFLLQALPEAKDIGNGYFGVPFTLANAQVLRHFNYPVPPVITEENYGWPTPNREFKPYESQRVAANFMILHPRCFNLSSMGSGKTASALWASDYLMRQEPAGACKTLVVAPLSILQRKWADDIHRIFRGTRTCKILHGDAAKRIKLLDEPADYYLINHDGVGVGAKTRKKFELDGFSKILAERDDIKIAILDEGSAYKDATTHRHRIARIVLAKRSYCWLMTGSPVPNAPTDAYGLGKIINNCYGKSFTTFRLETMYKISQFRWLPAKDGYEKAYKLLTPAIRIDIKDVWDAPPMVMRQREVPLTASQKKLFADLKRDLQVAVASGQLVTAPNEGAARLKFMQVSLGAIYDENHKTHYIDASPRIAELRSVLEQAPGKCLVFAPFTSVVNLLYKELSNDYSCRIVNGEVSQKERSEIFKAFQEDVDPRILIADPGTMSHGLDLYAAQTIVWYGPVDKPELFEQANHRAHRPGQKFPVAVVQIVSNPLEREIFRRLENNLSLQGSLLEMVKRGQL